MDEDTFITKGTGVKSNVLILTYMKNNLHPFFHLMGRDFPNDCQQV